jgi:queuine tRNA-ribosyltransferase catalytic subunit
MKSPALTFKILKTFGKCRASVLTLPHGQVRTPVYMPVGTKGAMKGVLSSNLSDKNMIDCDIMLNNTYHLFLKPGEDLLNKVGGAHKFMNWDRNLLTDSGGFQIVSLGELNTLDEKGVTFESHIDKRVF